MSVLDCSLSCPIYLSEMYLRCLISSGMSTTSSKVLFSKAKGKFRLSLISLENGVFQNIQRGIICASAWTSNLETVTSTIGRCLEYNLQIFCN